MNTLLLIEDTPEHGNYVESLVGEGCRLIRANSIHEGLSMAASQHPDLIMLDLSAPKIDGWVIVNQLRHNPEMDSTPIIAVIAEPGHETESDCLPEGCDACIAKPFQPDALRQTVSRLAR